ncbi:WhiB family transcriptional regulator [Streptomyces anulatus]|uniref:WhiB family transcriptional regulator n=1 Tax=Streptomyces anulatus TaxID=1892 RepID=UPI001D18C837|nr:WhiB family transcriptional regulator [Streptomyces anulatus]
MTPTQARHTRRAVLQATIDAGSRCAGLGVEAFFRGDDESAADWQPRRDAAARICSGCTVRAACEELALHSGDGEPDADDMVRAGLTGPELASARDHQAVRLAVAVDHDRDTEGRHLDDLTVQLHCEATKNPDKASRARTVDAARAAQNTAARELTAQVREIRSARRARAGWGVAA